jgi:hypothetical protein
MRSVYRFTIASYVRNVMEGIRLLETNLEFEKRARKVKILSHNPLQEITKMAQFKIFSLYQKFLKYYLSQLLTYLSKFTSRCNQHFKNTQLMQLAKQ